LRARYFYFLLTALFVSAAAQAMAATPSAAAKAPSVCDQKIRSDGPDARKRALDRAPGQVLSRLVHGTDQPATEVPLGLSPHLLETGDAAEVVAFGTQNSFQLTGVSSDAGRLLEYHFTHTLACSEEVVVPELSADGTATFAMPGDSPVVTASPPWAFDSAGVPLKTWFEVRGEVLVQLIDGTAATGEIFFDPTYTFMLCANGYWSNLSAGQYLDVYGPNTDYGYCAPAGVFNARLGYSPVWAEETNVKNDYGLGSCVPRWRLFLVARHRTFL